EHRPLPISAARRAGGTDQRDDAEGNRSAAESPDTAIPAQKGRLQHHPGRQMAPWLTAGIRSAQERIRAFLWNFQRRRRLFQSRRSEEHTSELQSLAYLVCRLLLEKKK